MQTTVSVRGQTVIPREIRKKLDITPATRLEWMVKNGVIIVLPLPPDPVRSSVGILKGRGVSTKDLLTERKIDREKG
ncbi:MAG: AbrB/MazE/SpoVT family DNA-binding domain-containing protein [Anaerolineales bacterium]|jgi:AbrB family looped-hinge helix DNA binding protein|nr:AbrB/MazE/SpoVT family DNA-binding domain-containing protein [Anaerolineales bacterium]